MNEAQKKAQNLIVAYIGGGSRGWAWGFMTDLAMDPDLCGTVRLYDTDRSAAERNEIIGNKSSAHPDAVSRWRYEVSDSLKEALTLLTPLAESIYALSDWLILHFFCPNIQARRGGFLV